tara:strand:- start:1470 stop:1658 length:189 start_codon:yes stop_codon:yes gene_type:complete
MKLSASQTFTLEVTRYEAGLIAEALRERLADVTKDLSDTVTSDMAAMEYQLDELLKGTTFNV